MKRRFCPHCGRDDVPFPTERSLTCVAAHAEADAKRKEYHRLYHQARHEAIKELIRENPIEYRDYLDAALEQG